MGNYTSNLTRDIDRSNPCIVYSMGKIIGEYNTQMDAAKAMGVSKHVITTNITGKTKRFYFIKDNKRIKAVVRNKKTA